MKRLQLVTTSVSITR